MRDYEKYVYTELAIPRNSAWYPLLEAEAAAKGVPLVRVVLQRLADSYLGASQSALPAATAPDLGAITRPLPSLPSATQASIPTPIPPVTKPPVVGQALADDSDEEEPELREEQAANNVAAFLQAGDDPFF